MPKNKKKEEPTYMTMTMAYAHPTYFVPYKPDTRTRSQYIADRKAAKRPSRNESTTVRRYNADGICCYCHTKHQSFHGHSYEEEFIFYGDRLVRRVTPENGQPTETVTFDVAAWKRSQRRDLLEN